MRNAFGSVQSALVLGGGSDIAAALVRRLAEDRLRTVGLAVRDAGSVAPLEAELEAAGVRVEILAFDADDVESHDAVMASAFDAVGEVDVVVVAFGALGHGAQRDRHRALALARTNFVGAVSAVLAAVDRLQAQGHGTVIVLSSVAGERVRKANFAYGATKAGLDGFCQGLGDSLAGTGVDVMVVRPGFVTTKMTEGLDPPPFSTSPEKVADAIVQGIRRRSHTVWAPPILRPVMSVLRHLPRPVFRRLPL